MHLVREPEVETESKTYLSKELIKLAPEYLYRLFPLSLVVARYSSL